MLNLFLRTVNEGILALFLSTILFVFFQVAIVNIKMSRHDALVITSMEEETLIPAISHIGKLGQAKLLVDLEIEMMSWESIKQ